MSFEVIHQVVLPSKPCKMYFQVFRQFLCPIDGTRSVWWTISPPTPGTRGSALFAAPTSGPATRIRFLARHVPICSQLLSISDYSEMLCSNFRNTQNCGTVRNKWNASGRPLSKLFGIRIWWCAATTGWSWWSESPAPSELYNVEFHQNICSGILRGFKIFSSLGASGGISGFQNHCSPTDETMCHTTAQRQRSRRIVSNKCRWKFRWTWFGGDAGDQNPNRW